MEIRTSFPELQELMLDLDPVRWSQHDMTPPVNYQPEQHNIVTREKVSFVLLFDPNISCPFRILAHENNSVIATLSLNDSDPEDIRIGSHTNLTTGQYEKLIPSMVRLFIRYHLFRNTISTTERNLEQPESSLD